MTKAYAVIGSGYGDEGKGLFTDYLSSKCNSSIVVRFNGGAQAGHTVTTEQGQHVFGHFSSNSFLENSITCLSKHFILNPLLYLKELNQLNLLGLYPNVMISEDCFITTPFDMLLNQWIEQKRAKNNTCHGSCGVGFGETIERSEKSHYVLQIKHLINQENVKNILTKIRNDYFLNRIKILNLEDTLKENNFVLEDCLINKYIEDLYTAFYNKNVIILKENLPTLDLQQEIVFEGAQGLLLDQKMGHFPYVTRSNTGLKNIIDLLKGSDIEQLEIVYATRCYTTRHGAGPLSNELFEKPYIDIEDKTNIPNQFQGTLRYSYLDLDILKDCIEKDLASVNIPSNLQFNIKIGISCLDQTQEVQFYENKTLKKLATKEFVKYVSKKFNISLLVSYGPSRTTIEEYSLNF